MNTHTATLALCSLSLALLLFCSCADDESTPASTEDDSEVQADTAFDVKYPFWSGDGKKILCIGYVFGDTGDGLYEVEPQGGIPTLLMRDSLAKRNPVLSPDGSRIAYLCAPMFKLWSAARVWVVNRDGSGATDLTPFGGNWEYLRWSPDSRYVIFDGPVAGNGEIDYQICRVDVLTGKPLFLTSSPANGRDATYTGDGSRIVYSSGVLPSDMGVKVWIMGADGSHPQPIDTSRRSSTSPRIRPGSGELWFSFGMDYGYDDGTYAVGLEGSEIPLQSSSYRFLSPEHFLPSAQWSPDGRSFVSLVATSGTAIDLRLTIADSMNASYITHGSHVVLNSLAWSPDGGRLVFNAVHGEQYASDIFVYDIATGSLSCVPIHNH